MYQEKSGNPGLVTVYGRTFRTIIDSQLRNKTQCNACFIKLSEKRQRKSSG
jgi:hypothetical protein